MTLSRYVRSDPPSAHGLSAILDRVTDAILSVDASWRITFVNATAAALTGKDAFELIDTVIWDSMPELRNSEFEVKARRAAASGHRLRHEEFLAGYGFWAEIDLYPSGGDRTIYLRDGTARKKAEDESHYHRALLRAVGEAVIGTDAAGVVMFWNPAATALYGWSAEDAVGKHILELTPSELSKAQADEIMQAVQNGKSWSGQFAVRRKNGSTFLAHVTDTPIYDERQALVGIVGISYDCEATSR